MVLDDISGRAELIEVKRNPAKLDMGDLRAKGKVLEPLLKKYDITYRGLSMDDVRSSLERARVSGLQPSTPSLTGDSEGVHGILGLISGTLTLHSRHAVPNYGGIAL